jgi:glycosyltransferase involved in cell wall biosynthesis
MLDIIIPAYNAHKTIVNTLSSISIQTMSHLAKVTIVNDGGDGYEHIINFFKGNLNIQEIYTKNGGPAIARQIGLERTNNPFVVFIDADDVLANAFSLKFLLENIVNHDNVVCVNSKFISETEDGNYTSFGFKEFIWLFGNIYRRNFIEENNIKFPLFSANEDLIFNLELNIKSMQNNKEIVYIDDFTYIWKFNPNSITRRDNNEYSFFESSYHIIKGKTELFKKFDVEEIASHVFESVWDFYYFWEESIFERKEKPDYHNTIMEACREFYDTYKDILNMVTDEQWKNLNKNKKTSMNYYNRIAFLDFINLMKR